MYLLHRATGGGYDSASRTLPVTVADNDTAAVVLSPAGITVNEGDTIGVNYTVKLSHAPAGAVTVTIGGHSGTALSISGTTLNASDELTFTASNWSAAQTVTVKADNDANAASESLKLTHTPSGGGYSTAADLPVTVTDDDSAAIVLSETALTLTEGDDTGVSYTVELATQPSETVTVTIGGHSGTDLSISGTTLSNTNTLTFTTSNWSTAQTVTVKAEEDDNADDESETLTHTPSGGGYSTAADLPVTVTDDDTAAIVLSETALTLTEGDDTGVSYTVKLAAQPSGDVTVTIGGHSGTDLSISGTTLSNTNTLTFTTSNWSTAQTVTVKAEEDDNADDESETLTHTASGGDYANITKDLPATVTDDAPATVTVSFGAASYTVAEGSSRTVTVSLDANPERTVVIPIETANQGGATTADYSGVPENVTFDSGDTSKSFTFTAEADTDDDDGESVKLSFGSSLPAGVSAGTTHEATVSITDDDVPSVTVSFGAAAYTVAESDDTGTVYATENAVEVTVMLSADPERTVVIPIEAANQGGATTADYSGVPENVTFDSGDTSKSFTFTAEIDSVDDDGESVLLSFGSSLPDGVSAGTPNETTVSITDDDVPVALTVQFGQAAYTVAEGSTVTVKVTLSGDPEMDLTIPISKTNEGGATSADYSGVPPSVTFNSGDTEKTFVFTAEADAVDDDGESVKLSFGALPTTPIAVAAGTTDEATVTITDDDVPSVTVSFGAAAYTVAESDDTGTANATENAVEVTVMLSADPERTVVIPIEAANQGGATTADYSGVPENVTFEAGDTSKSFTFTAEADAIDDDGESALLSFGATLPDGVSAGTPATSTVTITDDDVPSVTVSFGSDAYTVAEGGTQQVTVTLSADPERTVVIPIEAANQGGATTADYSGVPQNVTFDSGDTSKSFTFTAEADAIDDDGESVLLSFGATLPDGVSAGTPATSTVTITDDDVPSVTVSFGSDAYTVAEGGTQQVTVTLSADPEHTVVIPIEAANEGGATSADYSGVPQSVTFDSGDTEKTFVFTAETDTVDDDGESVLLSLGATLPAGVTAGTPATSTVTITDDDVPSVTVSFGSASYTVAESDDSDTPDVTENTVEVTLTLSADPERTVVIPIEAANEGGATSADYSGVPQSVTFNSGDTEKTFTFTAAHDTVDDDGESVKLSFGATLPDGVSAGTPATSAVTITDDDVPSVTVSFASAAYTVAESDDSDTPDATENTVEVTVTLDADPERTVVIPIEKTNQGGATTADYSGVPENVTFEAGDTSRSFTFTAAHDTVDDDGESVLLSFGATLPDGVSAGTPTTSTVNITDDDVPSVTVSFGSDAYTVAEGGTQQVTVTLSADSERTVVIPIEAANQGGATTADYSGVPPSVTFDAGDTSKSFDLSAETDTVDDDGESVKLSFGSSLPAGVSAGTTHEATVSITDDDVPSVTVSFGAAAYTVAESDDTGTANATENAVEVTVMLSADPERTVVIPIEAANQNGATTADYSGVPQNVTFDSGDTSKSFTFTAEADAIDDDGESVLLSFGATLPDGVSAGTPATSAVSITDDDVPQVTVSFGAAAYTVAESDDTGTANATENAVEVTVMLSADPERTVVIPIEAANQGGATTADYSGVPQNVTFNSGDTEKTFVFTAETDTVDDDGESVLLSFDTMPDARVSEGSPSEAMVTIRQDSTQSTADCNSAIWCADLEFRTTSAPNEMWFLDSKFLDSQFHYGDATYRFGHMHVAPYGHNIPISGQPSPPFAIPERTKFYFFLHNMNASGYDLDRFRVPNDDWMDWTLHISTTKNGETLTAVLPLSEARFGEGNWAEWSWSGSDLEALRAAWTEGQVYKLKIVEDPRSQRTPKVLGPPLYLKVTPYTNHTLRVWWKMPENRVDRAPPNTTYKVQWKEASGSWDNPADVSEEADSPSPATNEIGGHSIRGLTGGVEYNVRVIATNPVGDSEPSEVVSGTPKPLPAQSQNAAANSPAGGAPSIEGTPEVGQTLSAVTTDITDDDGLQDVVFSYQWLADDVEISFADGATYILTSNDLGKAINVRVDFTDNAGNEESLTSAPTAAVTATEDLELQSATVDGSTLTLTYNATLDNSVTPPSSAFTVNVDGESRSLIGVGVGTSSVLLFLSTAVESGDTVTVDYTKPSGSDVIKDTQGRQADSFTGQAVTNNTAPAETERSDPAQTPGSPNSLKVVRHESGKLMATWAAPDSSSDPTGYTLQWKEAGDGWETQDSVSQADVKGTSHLITGLTDGVEYAVRVIASKDDSESAPSGEVTATPRETTPPSPSSVSVNGATLTVTFDEALAEVQAPASTAFAVTVAGNSRGVSAVAVSGSAVTLTLVTAVSEGDAVTVDYTAPTGESAARLQDLAGNAAASFSGLDAGNDTQAADQLTASAHDVPGSHDGSTVFTFELRFSENFYVSYKTLRDHAFTVTGGEVTGARRLAPPSHIGWEIQVEPDGDGAATIVLPVTTDCTAKGAICTEEGRMLSGGLLLVLPGPNTPATGAPTISGTALVGETLAADTTGIADDDGLNSAAFSYQWLDDDEINGATASTYTLVAADAGKAIKVQVSFTDDAGNDEEMTSAATAAVAAAPPPPNTPATGLPTISGTAQVGENLAADTTGIADDDGLDNAAFSYQWLADDVEINGATASTYTLVAADAGKAIKVQVSFTDDAGNEESLTSAATGAVTQPLTATIHDAPDSHDGQSKFTFELRFSEEFGLSYKTLRDHAFTVTGGEVVKARRLEKGKNVRWEIHVRPDSSADVTIVLPATADCASDGTICTEDGRMLSSRLVFTVSGP